MKKILSLILVLMLAISVAAVAEGSEKKDSWLCDEKTTLTVFCDEGASNTMPVPSNDLPFWAWLEDYTNVHIEWECIPSASYDEVLSARLAAGQDLADVIVVGGTSLRSKESVARSGLPRYLAAMEEVVPPQTMCLPSLEKNRLIMRSQSSRLDGGPKSRFIGTRRRTRTTQAVASSPGSPP